MSSARTTFQRKITVHVLLVLNPRASQLGESLRTFDLFTGAPIWHSSALCPIKTLLKASRSSVDANNGSNHLEINVV